MTREVDLVMYSSVFLIKTWDSESSPSSRKQSNKHYHLRTQSLSLSATFSILLSKTKPTAIFLFFIRGNWGMFGFFFFFFTTHHLLLFTQFSSLVTYHLSLFTHHLKYPNFLYPPVWHMFSISHPSIFYTFCGTYTWATCQTFLLAYLPHTISSHHFLPVRDILAH